MSKKLGFIFLKYCGIVESGYFELNYWKLLLTGLTLDAQGITPRAAVLLFSFLLRPRILSIQVEFSSSHDRGTRLSFFYSS